MSERVYSGGSGDEQTTVAADDRGGSFLIGRAEFVAEKARVTGLLRKQEIQGQTIDGMLKRIEGLATDVVQLEARFEKEANRSEVLYKELRRHRRLLGTYIPDDDGWVDVTKQCRFVGREQGELLVELPCDRYDGGTNWETVQYETLRKGEEIRLGLYKFAVRRGKLMRQFAFD